MEEEDINQVSSEEIYKNIPASYEDFLEKNQVAEDNYELKKIYRFLRVNEKLMGNIPTIDICNDLNDQVEKLLQNDKKYVEYIPYFSEFSQRFFRLDTTVPISRIDSYIKGEVYGIDISSAAVVIALDLKQGNQVLDLCCAPGAKLAMISDILTSLQSKETHFKKFNNNNNLDNNNNNNLDNNNNNNNNLDNNFISNNNLEYFGTITGVDISCSRLNICKKLLKKYQLLNVRLFQEDASTFNILAPQYFNPSERILPKDSLFLQPNNLIFPDNLDSIPMPWFFTNPSNFPKNAMKSQKKHKSLPRIHTSSDWRICHSACQLYDRVLVDCQCTLDASIRHILKYNKVGLLNFQDSQGKDLNPTLVIITLQKKIIFNAFRLLKPNGFLVYSTCSFSILQNEDIVSWLLKSQPDARIVPITFSNNQKMNVSKGFIDGTVRFYPKNTGTSGMFIAKITKIN